MESKHTPGPWKRAHHGHYKQIQIYTENFYHPLAVVQDTDDMQANAALIAAAPAMLEALDSITKACSGNNGIDLIDDDLEALIVHVRATARAAIAEARKVGP